MRWVKSSYPNSKISVIQTKTSRQSFVYIHAKMRWGGKALSDANNMNYSDCSKQREAAKWQILQLFIYKWHLVLTQTLYMCAIVVAPNDNTDLTHRKSGWCLAFLSNKATLNLGFRTWMCVSILKSLSVILIWGCRRHPEMIHRKHELYMEPVYG